MTSTGRVLNIEPAMIRLQRVMKSPLKKFRPMGKVNNSGEFSTITGTAPPAGKDSPTGHGTPAEVAGDLLRYRETAGLDAFQINFHGNGDLGQPPESERHGPGEVVTTGLGQIAACHHPQLDGQSLQQDGHEVR